MLDIPVAFVVFNRPELTARTFAPIRRARPSVLCIISDGPREDRSGEAELVRKSRQIAEACDWPCHIERIYSDVNLGCGQRVSSGISAVFEKHERAIIIEDDCEVNDSFFHFCGELLDRYQDDERVMSVSGDNFHGGREFGDASYFFSKYFHCWGWATWRRAWRHSENALASWPAYRDSQEFAAMCDSPLELDYWKRIFNQVYEGGIDTWDYPWMLACWMQHGLTALPNKNLVSNLGFGEGATHTNQSSPLANLPAVELGRITHPARVARSLLADRRTDRAMYSRGRMRGRYIVQLCRDWAQSYLAKSA